MTDIKKVAEEIVLLIGNSKYGLIDADDLWPAEATDMVNDLSEQVANLIRERLKVEG